MAASRIFIVDDHPAVRRGLRLLLETQPDLQVVGEASSGEEALDAVLSVQPEIVLMDIRLPGMDGVAATNALKRRIPDLKVVMLSAYSRYFPPAIKAGADGYVTKDTPGLELIRAVRGVLRNHSLVMLSTRPDEVESMTGRWLE